MGIIWCGGDGSSFPDGHWPISVTTDSSRFRSDFAQCAIANDGVGAPISQLALSKPFTGGAVSSCWFQFRLYIVDTGYVINYSGLTRTGATNGSGLYLATAGNWKLRLVKWDGTTATQIFEEVTSSLMPSHLHVLTMELINYGANATVRVYNGSVKIIEFTGDARVGAITDFDRVGVGGQGYASREVMSEFIVADEDPRTFSVFTGALNEAGDVNDWTGAFTDVNEITTSDSNYIYTNAADKDFRAGLKNLPTGDFNVKAVMKTVRACKTSDSAINHLAIGEKSGSTVTVDAVPRELTTIWDTYERLDQVNPATSAAYTLAEINALLIDLRSVAGSYVSPSASLSPSVSRSPSASSSASPSA